MKHPIRSYAELSSTAIRRSVAYTAVGLALLGAQAGAHHAFSSVFDPQQPLSLEGKVTKVEWMNPHTWFYIDTEKEDGEIENWGFEMGSPNTLARRGWNRSSLMVGDDIIVVGWRARDGTMRGAVASVTLANGQQLFGAQDASR